MSLPTVSVVIPVRNGVPQLARLLDALHAQEGVTPVEVIVVDNASTDATVALATNHPIKPLVVSEPGIGSYRARNTGAAHATGEILAFTDADCLPNPRWLLEGLTALEHADLAGGGVVPVTGPNPSVWAHYDATFYLRQEHNVGGGFAATANLFVKRATFDKVDGFNADFVSGGDHDFSIRARAVGAELVYAPNASVEHTCRRTMGEVWKLQTRIGGGWGSLRSMNRRPVMWRDPAHRYPFEEFARFVPNDVDPKLRRQYHLIHYMVIFARLYGQVRFLARLKFNNLTKRKENA